MCCHLHHCSPALSAATHFHAAFRRCGERNKKNKNKNQTRVTANKTQNNSGESCFDGSSLEKFREEQSCCELCVTPFKHVVPAYDRGVSVLSR